MLIFVQIWLLHFPLNTANIRAATSTVYITVVLFIPSTDLLFPGLLYLALISAQPALFWTSTNTGCYEIQLQVFHTGHTVEKPVFRFIFFAEHKHRKCVCVYIFPGCLWLNNFDAALLPLILFVLCVCLVSQCLCGADAELDTSRLSFWGRLPNVIDKLLWGSYM